MPHATPEEQLSVVANSKGGQRFLLVEDNEGDAYLTCERLAEAPGAKVHVDIATTLAQAMGLLAVNVVDVIILDLNLSDSHGLDTLCRIKAVAGTAPVIVVSGQCDDALRTQALADGAEDVISKDEANSRLFCRSVLYVIERNRARARQQRLQDLLDATPDAILAVTPGGDVRFVNEAAAHLFDRTREELLAAPMHFSAMPGATVDLTIQRAGGARRCELRIANIEWDGEPVHLASIRDVTERQQADHLRARSVELELQNWQMQESSRLKSDFLANISHEIRTPMNAVIGLSYLLERSTLDADQTAMLNSIKVAGKTLLGIINNVLDVSKIEAGEMRIEQVAFSPAEVMHEVAQMMTLQAQEKGVGFRLEIPQSLPPGLTGDVTRLRQVLNNLLSNAIKFTERGQVQLRVQVIQAAKRPGETALLRFCCLDSGIGISEEALARLFTPFAQADETTTRRFGGTGLGLSIVKQLALLMGGEVGARSEPGVGSEFWAELPFAVCEASALVVAPARNVVTGPALSGIRVLVADDSAINLQVARRILELEGAQVHVASDGQQAVDFLRTRPKAVDLVLMDVQMPVLDGLMATQQIRGELGLVALPVIALTAGLSDNERHRLHAAGMNDLVGKPFDPPELIRCMLRYLDTRDHARAHATAMPVRTDQPDWPQIDGIDTRDVATRFGGDSILFCSMLKRLLRDFSDLAHESTAPESLHALAARMHNLKGSAATLGAKSLAALAADVESACRSKTVAPVVPLIRQIAAGLEALRIASSPVLANHQANAIQHQPPQGPLDTAALDAFLIQLKGGDLEAARGFQGLADHLRSLMDADAFDALGNHMDNLQFRQAALAVEVVVAGQIESANQGD